MTSCDCVSVTAIVHADRRSRSVDSGLVTDVDLQQRAPTAVTAAAVEPSSSAPLHSRVIGSCDSGLPQHVEQDSDVYITQDSVRDDSVHELTICDSSSTVTSPSVSLKTQRPDDVDCQSSPVSVAVTDNRQSWLLRLFESKLFDMSIAIQYLFNSKESGVQTYIGESFGCVPVHVVYIRKCVCYSFIH